MFSLRLYEITGILFMVFLFSFSLELNAQENDEIQSLLLKVESCEIDTVRINLLLEIASAYKNIDKGQSIKFSKQAYQLSSDIENESYYCRSILKYAYYLYVANHYDSSLIILEKSESDIISNNDSLLKAEMYILYGSIYLKQYNFKDAQFFLNKGINLSSTKKTKIVGRAYIRLGIIHNTYAEYDSSIYFYLKNMEISEAIFDTVGLIAANINIGDIFISLKDYDKAKAYYLTSLELLSLKAHPQFESLTYIKLGSLNANLNNYQQALDYYGIAYDIVEETNNEIDKGDIINNIGHIYFRQGVYKEAQIQFEKSLEIFKRIGYVSGELTSRYNLAVIYSEKKDYKYELAMLDTVIIIAADNNMLDWTSVAYNNMAMTYYSIGSYQQAYDTLRKWIVLNDSIFNINKAESITELELKYEKEKNESKILALENKTLQKDLEIKQKINQRNLISGSGIAIVIILSLLFFFHRQRTRKDRIIKEKEISRLKEEKKALAAQSIVEGQEEERKRVARELHDGLGVLLSNVKMQFSSFMDKSTGNKDLLSKAANVLNQASVDVRRISHNMMPGNLSKFGLVAAIEDLFEEISESGVIKAEIKSDLVDERFSENKEIMLYRIVQELANNTIKHAGATSISLNINKLDHKLLVNYADNGSGFDLKKVKPEKSMGLKSIENRVSFLGGELSNESVPGKGASFSFDFPL